MADSKIIRKPKSMTHVSNSDPVKAVGSGAQVVGISRVSQQQPAAIRNMQLAPNVVVSPPGQRNTPGQHGGLEGGERQGQQRAAGGAMGVRRSVDVSSAPTAVDPSTTDRRFTLEEMDLLDHVLGEFAKKQSEPDGDPRLATLAKMTYETARSLAG